MKKSNNIVAMEQQVCIACGKRFDTGSILLSRRLDRDIPRAVATGWGLCPEHRQKVDEGYVILVALDPAKSSIKESTETVRPADACRTGDMVYVKNAAFDRVFNVARPQEGVAFVEPEVIAMLKQMAPPPEDKS